jgi:hypothetical protein
LTSFGSVAETRVYVLCVVGFNYVVESLVGRRREKKKKEQTICFVLERKM